MGTKTFDGVWFLSYSDDHDPPHVHGRYAEVEVIVELIGGVVQLAERRNAIKPKNAKQSDVSKVLRTATEYAGELMDLWRTTHGEVDSKDIG